MLNERLRKLREERNITQGQLAQEIGVEKSSISKYESRSNPIIPSVDVIIAIADYFFVSVDYLLCRTDEPRFAHPKADGGMILSAKKELPEHPPEEPTMRMDLDLPNDLPRDQSQLEKLISSMIEKALEDRNRKEP